MNKIVNGVLTPVPLVCCSTDLGNYFGNNANNEYEALVIKGEKRFSQGLQFMAFYTYSKANAYNNGYYAVGPKYAYGPNDMNRNHQFIVNVVYALPFGRGQKYMSNISKPANFLLGGWTLTQTLNWSGGLPWTPSIGECNNVGSGSAPCLPNIVSPTFNTGVSRRSRHRRCFLLHAGCASCLLLESLAEWAGFLLLRAADLGRVCTACLRHNR